MRTEKGDDMSVNYREWMVASGLLMMLVVGCTTEEPKKIGLASPTLQDKKVVFAPEADGKKDLGVKKEIAKKDTTKKMKKTEALETEMPVVVMGGGFVASEPLKSVYFDSSKSDLSEEAMTVIAENATWLKTQPPYLIQIAGVSDKRGSPARNKTLAERRALNVKNAYMAQGLDPERIQIIALGENIETCPAMDEACLRFTRRADTLLEEKAVLAKK